MSKITRRLQLAITIRSERATERLRKLVKPDHSQTEVIEGAPEQETAARRSLATALTSTIAFDFDWEPPYAQLVSRNGSFPTRADAGL